MDHNGTEVIFQLHVFVPGLSNKNEMVLKIRCAIEIAWKDKWLHITHHPLLIPNGDIMGYP